MGFEKKLKGSICFDVSNSDRNLDLESGVLDTEDQCKLNENESGIQRVCIKSSKRRHTIDAEIELGSQNNCVEYNSSGVTTCEESITMPPAKIGSPSSAVINVDISQCSNQTLSEETLETRITYEYGTPSQEITGPSVFPRIHLG
ncbi:hypothetical protein [Halomontanus rarus]|uniref:hypothetical protein n=1 Tax=Halomontanus rarus TaxID=3034020 RepID=UPI001A995A5D